MSVLREKVLNIPSEPVPPVVAKKTLAKSDDEPDDREYTQEKVLPLMISSLCSLAQQNKTHFKLSDCKDMMMAISERFIVLGVELLIQQGVVKPPQGRSRVPTYEIVLSALPMPLPQENPAKKEEKKEEKKKTQVERVKEKPVESVKRVRAPVASYSELDAKEEEEEILPVPSKKRAWASVASEFSDMVSPKKEKKVHISLPGHALPNPAIISPVCEFEVSEIEVSELEGALKGALEGELEGEESKSTIADKTRSFDVLYNPPALSEEAQAEENREVELETAVVDRLLALVVDAAPLQLFVESVLANHSAFSASDVRRMLDKLQDRNKVMLDDEMILVI